MPKKKKSRVAKSKASTKDWSNRRCIMHYFEYASADATMYEGTVTQSQNTGLDEILEIRKDTNNNASVINVSRGILYAGDGNLKDVLKAAENYTEQIRKIALKYKLPDLKIRSKKYFFSYIFYLFIKQFI